MAPKNPEEAKNDTHKSEMGSKKGTLKSGTSPFTNIWKLPPGLLPLNNLLKKEGPVKLMRRMKTAHSFLQSVLNLFHFIILSLPM